MKRIKSFEKYIKDLISQTSECKCPKCGAEINYLHNVQRVWKRYNMTIDKKGYAEYQESKEWEDDVNDFDCPECEETLFTNEEDAINFLKKG